MSSGDIASAPGPNSDPGFTEVFGGATQTDQDLNLAASGGTTFDAAVLEFDFIPIGDSVIFRYVFASEEYNEYVCSNVNDIFGFLISKFLNSNIFLIT